MKNNLYTEPFEHYESEPKDHSNAILCFALGVMITLCAIIGTVTNVLSVMV